jgi:hypothetical protein
MTPETEAYILKIVHNVHAWKAEEDAKEPERQRLKLETRMAIERLHRANVALRAALSR